jgi:OHCU decarboxylase
MGASAVCGYLAVLLEVQKIKVYNNLAKLNRLSAKRAEAAFLDCCGSREWARQMAARRPFAMIEPLFAAADEIWFSLTPADWLEAFAAHPKIGSNSSAPSQKRRAAKWSQREQNGMAAADRTVREQLDAANRLYLEKFGFIFVVCATGKTADEMLAICKARLRNSTATELKIAAEEQLKITEIRLTKLLE